jgi:hypothetical protein
MNRENEHKSRFVRAIAFEIHRKRTPEEAVIACVEAEGRGGRHRILKPALAVVEDQGFVAALLAVDMLSAETASVLAPVVESGDTRLLVAVLNNLAEFIDQR